MKILIISPQIDGCYYWREQVPTKALRALGHDVRISSDLGDLYNPVADLLVISRQVAVESPDQLMARIAPRVRVVYDVDDAIDLIPVNSPAFAMPHYYHCYHYFVQVADLVTVSTDRLRDHLLPLRGGRPIAVLPNRIDPRDYPGPATRRERGVLRVGWSGTTTHLEDLLPAAAAMVRLQQSIEFTPVLMGLGAAPSAADWLRQFLPTATREVATAARELTTHLGRLRGLQLAPGAPIGGYPAALAALALDVALAPLAPSAFNACKSPIKVYESALAGAAAVASAVPPYSDDLPAPWCTPHTADGWAEAIGALLTDERARQNRRDEQRAWVLSRRTIDEDIRERERTYASVLRPASTAVNRSHMIVGLACVRDNADVIEDTVRHLLAHGVDRIFFFDHKSQDGTSAILDRLAKETGKIDVERREDKFYDHGLWVNELLRKAEALGPTWIVPFDADEIVVPLTQPTLAAEFVAAGDSVLSARVWQHASLDRRAKDPIEHPKVVFSWHPGCSIAIGAHRVHGHPGPTLDAHVAVRERHVLSEAHFIKKTRQHLESRPPHHDAITNVQYLERRGMGDAQLARLYREWERTASAVHDPIPLLREPPSAA